MKLIRFGLLCFIGSAALIWWAIGRFLGPVGFIGQEKVFIVPRQQAGFNPARALADQGLIKSAFAYRWLATKLEKGLEPEPGGYTFRGRLWAWQVARRLARAPDHRWVKTFGCLRREQVGEELARVLGWDEQARQQWGGIYPPNSVFWEGMYFPDEYLFSLEVTPKQIAEQFFARFEESVKPLESQRHRSGMDWPEVIKIASLVQREAAGENDSGLIAGIIHNRLDRGMKLQIDATMQYTLGQRADGSWWGPVDLSQKWTDSPYNSYLYGGLPPTPICSPGLPAIRAALEPEKTDCLYYLHAPDKSIHCAATYAEHKENIARYLQ